MAYLILVLIPVAGCIGFIVLTQYETQHGIRFFRAPRERFDVHVERVMFIVTHVDFLAFVQDTLRQGVNHAGHVIAHFSLQVVRAVERVLTRLVRHLRAKNEAPVPRRESSREFVKTLSDFKDTLTTTHLESEVHTVE